MSTIHKETILDELIEMHTLLTLSNLTRTPNRDTGGGSDY